MEKRTRTLRGIICLLLLSCFGWMLYQAWHPPVRDPKTELKPAEHVSALPTSRAAHLAKSGDALASFDSWAERFVDAKSAAEKGSLEQEGIAWARERRTAMYSLIQSDPKRAIESAVPFAIREQLPSSVNDLLEKPISDHGDFIVVAALPLPGKESQVAPIQRTATFGDTEYRAFVYGNRTGLPTERNIPLYGVAVDNVIAISENPVRVLDRAEVQQRGLAPAEAICAVSGNTVLGENNQPTAVDVGGQIRWLCHYEHWEELNKYYLAAAAQAGGSGGTGVDVSESPYTEGRKRIILFRVAFPDVPTPALTVASGESLITSMNQWWGYASYGRTTVALPGQGSDVVSVTLTLNSTNYDDNSGRLRTDVRAAATAQGIDLTKYDFDVTCTGSDPSFSFAGLAFVGAPGAWLANGYFGTGTAAHELGHNLGNPHANFWDTGGQSAIGTGGNEEYGDPYDVMGSGPSGTGYYVAKFKWHIGWISDADFPFISSSGTYRIYAHDNVDTRTGLRGVRFTRDGTLDYYLEVRQLVTGNPWMMNGVALRWGNKNDWTSQLIDTTPGSPDGKTDAPIAIGRTFSDPQANVHITPVAKGNTYPESIDVVVNFGPFPGNAAPRLVLSASSSTASAGAIVTLTASATDANGDPLAYYWDLGDRTFGSNSPVQLKSWSTPGDYIVRCTASDMKGGTASDSVTVRVGSPTTFSVSGRVLNNGKPLADVLVKASSTAYAYTDSDGTYTIPRLPTANYTLSAQLYPYYFANPFFANPVSVGPSKSNLDFVTVPSPVTGSDLVSSNSVWKYLDNGSDQGTAWIAPGFDDSLWPSGAAQLGYGDGDEATAIGYGLDPNNKYITSYFRQAFQVPDPTAMTNFLISLLRDDGAVIYLNGAELFRDNMPAGTIGYRTVASANADENAPPVTFNVPASALVSGRNVLAAEVHQVNATSSDLSFALALKATSISNLSDIAVAYISSPQESSAFRVPANITISANARSTLSTFTSVVFYANAIALGQSTASPFSVAWNDPAPGNYALTVIARDTRGINLTSAPVSISVQPPPRPLQVSLVSTGAVWKYLDNGSDQGTNWIVQAYDDSAWAFGPAVLGYGNGDEATVVGYGGDPSAKFITTYFRRSWNVPDPGSVSSLSVRVLRNDGFIAYLNGSEIFRNNVPQGQIDYLTPALSEVETNIFGARTLSPKTLVAGTNVLAVEVHQASATGPSISFDLELTAGLSTNRPPGVYLTSPTSGSNFTAPPQLDLASVAVPADPQTITKVAFLEGNNLLGEVFLAPFNFAWLSPPYGSFQLTAVAYQSDGLAYTSAPVSVTIGTPAIGQQLISLNSSWRYLDDGSDQGTVWRARLFNDSAWAEGYARLGYGGDGENTVVSFGPDPNKKFITTWFRHPFSVANPLAFNNLKLSISRDDGAVVYLNGLEVFRSNMRTGPVSYNSLALAAVERPQELAFIDANISPAGLVSGTNVIAVEVHQATLNSSDIGLDLSLVGEHSTNLFDGIYLTLPANGAEITLPGSIHLNAFALSSDPITNVEFFANGTKIGEDNTAPYDILWGGATSGPYALTAIASLASGATAQSPPVNITLTGPPMSVVAVSQTYITAGSTWQYWAAGNTPSTDWASPTYNDAGWPQGAARFGFGLDGEVTTLPPGRTTYYFRRSFTVTNPALLDNLLLEIQRDDGAVVYINGVEAFRSNMPDGVVSSNTAAAAISEGLDEQQFFPGLLPSSGVVAGTNLIAVEIHQASDTRIDLGFDLRLSGIGSTTPRVVFGKPASGSMFVPPAVIPLEAYAWPGQGRSVASVEFFVDGSKVAEDNSPPYTFDWNALDLGTHVLSARATDQFGESVVSDPVKVTLGYETVSATLIPAGSVWKFLDNGSNQGTGWTRTNFNDSAWSSGPARLGYSPNREDGEVTVVSYGPSSTAKYITTYFRRNFLLPANVTITNLYFRLLRDDGAVVYVNGREAFRSNMPAGIISYTTLASVPVANAEEFAYFPSSAAVSNLLPTNTVAVEVHQQLANSSDLGFDLEVTGNGFVLPSAPELSIELLSDGQIEISWDAFPASWSLHVSDQLGSSASWTPVSTAPVIRGIKKVLELTPGSTSQFYQLRR